MHPTCPRPGCSDVPEHVNSADVQRKCHRVIVSPPRQVQMRVSPMKLVRPRAQRVSNFFTSSCLFFTEVYQACPVLIAAFTSCSSAKRIAFSPVRHTGVITFLMPEDVVPVLEV